jgi:hypothetical protein
VVRGYGGDEYLRNRRALSMSGMLRPGLPARLIAGSQGGWRAPRWDGACRQQATAWHLAAQMHLEVVAAQASLVWPGRPDRCQVRRCARGMRINVCMGYAHGGAQTG